MPIGSQLTAHGHSHAGMVNSKAFADLGYVAAGSAIAKASGASQGIGNLIALSFRQVEAAMLRIVFAAKANSEDFR